MDIRKLTMLVAIVLVLGNRETDAQTTSDAFFDYEFSYTGDFISNMSGGIETGEAYLGMVTLQLSFDTESKHLWQGGEFSILGASTHGDEASAELIGDMQVASNIEAGNHTYIQELWYKQQLGNFNIKVGLQDMNAEMVYSDYALYFLNSSFGTISTVAENIPAPIFPLTALSVTAGYDITDDIYLQTAIYDGKVHDFENNRYNTNWQLGKEDGYIWISELQYNKGLISDLGGSYKFGYYYHNHGDSSSDDPSPNYGFYAICDQVFANWSNDGEIAAFLQLGISPKHINNHNNYIGFGLQATGLSDKRPEDVLALGVAYASFQEGVSKSETAIEATYSAQITERVSLQPDLQYILSPAGTEEVLDDAFVGTLRLCIGF